MGDYSRALRILLAVNNSSHSPRNDDTKNNCVDLASQMNFSFGIEKFEAKARTQEYNTERDNNLHDAMVCMNLSSVFLFLF